MRRTLFLVLAALVPSFAMAQPASMRLLPQQSGIYGSTEITHVSDDGSVIAGNLVYWNCVLYPTHFCTTAFASQAFRQAGTQPVEKIPTLRHFAGSPHAGVTAMSGDGAVVFGSSETDLPDYATFRYAGGQVERFESLPGIEYDFPVDASSDASVLLYYSALRIGDDLTPLPPLHPGDRREAAALSADTRIAVGGIYRNLGYAKAAVWTDGVLAVLPEPDGYVYAGARDVSDDGRVIVGVVQGATDPGKAALWSGGLPRVIEPDEREVTPLGSGWGSAFARAVSGDGRRVLVEIERPHLLDAPAEVRLGHEVFLWDEANGMRRVRDILRYDFGLPAGPANGAAGALSHDGRTIVGTQITSATLKQGWVVTLPDGCANGFDDDEDGYTDLEDPGCVDATDYSERGPGYACDDGIDEDDDGAADFPADLSCPSPTHPIESACADGLDDDGDGLVDFADPGCTDSEDVLETNWYVACDDTFDDDGDGLVDFLDPGCGGLPYGVDESPPCSDGVDNDGDGLVDFTEDPECLGRPDGLRERPGACGLGAELAAIVPALLWLRSRRRRS